MRPLTEKTVKKQHTVTSRNWYNFMSQLSGSVRYVVFSLLALVSVACFDSTCKCSYMEAATLKASCDNHAFSRGKRLLKIKRTGSFDGASRQL